MRLVASLLMASGVAVWSGCATSPQQGTSTPAPVTPVRNIVLLVADGAGVELWTAAEIARNDLAVKQMPVVGLVDTRSAHHKVTDSAAGASAYATGQRVTNRTLSVSAQCPMPGPRDPVADVWPKGCDPLDTWFRIARDKGKATGVVTTTYVVDATPAAFVAHSPSRYWNAPIAEQFANFRLDVLLGGGRQHFAGETRADKRDLLGEMCVRARCLSSGSELATYQPDERPLVGLFTPGDMDELPQRPVGLPTMVGAALAKLERDPDGFVAIFESEATDNATHLNAPLARITADMLEFDEAVRVALSFARRVPGTLVIVVGDHETGGIALLEVGTNLELKYTTRGHSAALVPLFAAGPQAERFGGFRENYEIGQMLLEITRGW